MSTHVIILIDEFGNPVVLDAKSEPLRQTIDAFGAKAVFADVIGYSKGHRKPGVYKVSMTQRHSAFDINHYEIVLLLDEASMALQKLIGA